MKNRFLIMDPKDNCATVLEEIPKDEKLEINDQLTIIIKRKIKFGHKFALKDIKQGEHIIKYGQVIGISTKDIEAGDWVHTRNVKSAYMEEKK